MADNDKAVFVESLHPELEVCRGGNGDLLIVQIRERPDGGIYRTVLITEMRHAVSLAEKILQVADHSFLNPVKPVLYNETRRAMN